ncbi:MAG: hypothetical protein KDJ31_20000 [Candidatus Competibacteraceae bacterium]|nr:hypothetical protein [Candidatus Competibacteraceae bacterium]
MKIATCTLKSISPYSQSRYHETPKLNKELHDDYRLRTWREHLHYDKNGIVYIPPMTFKNCLSEAAKFLGIQIPGKGKSTYTKHFEAGVLVMDAAQIGIHKDDVDHENLFLPSDGVRGSGKRVVKTYPVIREWQVTVPFYVQDDVITEEVFKYHLQQAGTFIGIGRFRPRNNGYYGRFQLTDCEWISD